MGYQMVTSLITMKGQTNDPNSLTDYSAISGKPWR